jgi:cell division protein FtsB
LEELEILRGQLSNVRAAIAAIESGAQEYQIANRRLAKADLATLYKRETEIKASIARLEDGGVYFAELGRL